MDNTVVGVGSNMTNTTRNVSHNNFAWTIAWNHTCTNCMLRICRVPQATRHAELEAIDQLLAAYDDNIDWSR